MGHHCPHVGVCRLQHVKELADRDAVISDLKAKVAEKEAIRQYLEKESQVALREEEKRGNRSKYFLLCLGAERSAVLPRTGAGPRAEAHAGARCPGCRTPSCQAGVVVVVRSV